MDAVPEWVSLILFVFYFFSLASFVLFCLRVTHIYIFCRFLDFFSQVFSLFSLHIQYFIFSFTSFFLIMSISFSFIFSLSHYLLLYLLLVFFFISNFYFFNSMYFTSSSIFELVFVEVSIFITTQKLLHFYAIVFMNTHNNIFFHLFGPLLKAIVDIKLILWFPGSCVNFPGGLPLIIIRSMMSKIIPSDELGMIFSMLASWESILPLVSHPLCTLVYNATIKDFPGTVYLMSSLFVVISTGIFAWVFFTQFVHCVCEEFTIPDMDVKKMGMWIMCLRYNDVLEIYDHFSI